MPIKQIKIYDASTFHLCQNDKHPLYDYLKVIMEYEPTSLVANINNCQCYVLEIGEKLLLLVDVHSYFHMSSGVGVFKLNRGAEYWSGFSYYKHLNKNMYTKIIEWFIQIINKKITKISAKNIF